MIKLIPTLLFVLMFVSCGSDCIDDKIVEFKANQDNCKGASIIKYSFNDKEVYAFTQGICISDGATVVYDKNCNQLCLLGGIAGFTKCEEIEFFSNAKELERLYENK